MGYTIKTTKTHDIQMKTISLALVLAAAWGTKLNSASTTSSSQHQIKDHNNNFPADSVDDENNTIGLI